MDGGSMDRGSTMVPQARCPSPQPHPAARQCLARPAIGEGASLLPCLEHGFLQVFCCRHRLDGMLYAIKQSKRFSKLDKDEGNRCVTGQIRKRGRREHGRTLPYVVLWVHWPSRSPGGKSNPFVAAVGSETTFILAGWAR